MNKIAKIFCACEFPLWILVYLQLHNDKELSVFFSYLFHGA